MGEPKRRRTTVEQQRKSGDVPASRREQYEWDPNAAWYRLARIDVQPIENGPLLDMDPDELDRQMQAEFERQTMPRRRK